MCTYDRHFHSCQLLAVCIYSVSACISPSEGIFSANANGNCEGEEQRVFTLVSFGPNNSTELPFIRKKLIPACGVADRRYKLSAEVSTFITP